MKTQPLAMSNISFSIKVTSNYNSVDRAGLERTQVGESAPSRLEGGSTSAGADKVWTLWNFTISHHGSRERNINQLAVSPNPRLLLDCQSFPLLFVRAAGEGWTLCCADILPSDGVRDRKEWITWSCATKRSCFRPFYELPLQRSS